MTALKYAAITIPSLMLLAAIAIPAAVVIAARREARAEDKRRAEQGRQVGASWLNALAGECECCPVPLPRRRPSDLSVHPSAARIRDRIAANEAARIDEEWLEMNR